MENSSNCIPLCSTESKKQDTICIFGTGDFGRSLGFKMLQCGYTIIFGSRNPKSNFLPKWAEVLSHSEAAEKSSIIIVAVHREQYHFLADLTEILKGKVLVDVSNNLKINQYPESNAEYLAKMIPGANVVKAFNTVSAWSLQSGTLDASRQLFRGTKYSRFPNWLDQWMLCRKQLGLVALAYAFLHAIYTLVMPIRYYVRWWSNKYLILQVTTSTTYPFLNYYAWLSDSYVALGILGFFFYVLLGITSLPSVSNAVNWREFRFVQSKLGYLTLVLCTAHTLVYGGDRFIYGPFYKWYLPPAFVVSLIIPCAVLVMKFIIVIPCLDKRITKIRQGWERNPSCQGALNTDINKTSV
ncbi:hypothetical protein FKM82_007024 [Ascaphus truei]